MTKQGREATEQLHACSFNSISSAELRWFEAIEEEVSPQCSVTWDTRFLIWLRLTLDADLEADDWAEEEEGEREILAPHTDWDRTPDALGVLAAELDTVL